MLLQTEIHADVGLVSKGAMAIQTITRDRPSGLGVGVINRAPAPSESIQRRNSLPKGSLGWSARSLVFNLIWGSKWDDRRLGEANSEPVTMALSQAPARTLR